MLRHVPCFFSILFLALVQAAAVRAETVTLDGRGPGRTFEGLAVLSGSGGTRLLIDYPEPQRSQIMDFLFKPDFGAAPHHLKVELGGDGNSTDGVEPSYARTREEFEHPRAGYFQRGYEWLVMHEAKKRNPRITLDVLPWAAPHWIGDKDFPDAGNPDTLDWNARKLWNRKKFYTQDGADFVAGFIRGAKRYQGLDIDFCGIWNETPYDVPWIKRLRKTLDHAGLGRVRVVAADEVNAWTIVDAMNRDPELKKAVSAVGVHYPHYRSPAAAKECGKPLWSSEDTPWRGDWIGARSLAKMCNRNYIEGKITKTVVCTLIGSYYDSLPMPSYGIVEGAIRANTPWSGHYEVQPGLWAFAHTAQFTWPGWKYLDGACGRLKAGGSCVCLRSPDAAGDYSVIIETVDAKTPQTLSFHVAGGLSAGPVHVWRSNQRSQFDRLEDAALADGAFSLTAEPDSIYSLTTTTGQGKGKIDAVPPAADFPFPYRDDFEQSAPGAMPKYFADQGGVFEVAERPGGGHCVRQTVALRGIDWHYHPIPNPNTIIGSSKWRDYEVGCDACVEKAGYVALFGRIVESPGDDKPPRGYWLKAASDGRWELNAFTKTLAAGTAPLAAGRWHKLSLRFAGRRIVARIDGVEVKALEDDAFSKGMAGLGSGWNTAMFDDFYVR